MAGPIASLTVRISAQIAELQKGMAEGTRVIKKFGDDFEGIATRASAVGSFFGNIAADMAKALVSNLGRAFGDAITQSQKFSNAFIGLSSVARAFGTSTDEAAAAARRLSADGLLPLGDAASGLKNLLAAGFNLPQATKLMEAFKDSAAFGRQGALSFGDAVRSATEGVKNGNSILVDNAGVTKNLSQILKEAGFSAQDLSRASTDVGVRMALFNGILKETAAQTGDAQKLTQTYTGQVSKLKTQYDTFLATLGDSITQNKTVAVAIGAVSQAFGVLAEWLTKNSNGYGLVSAAVIALVKVFAGTVRTIDIVQRAFNGLDSALVDLVKGFADATASIANLLVGIVKVAAKIPGSTIAITALANEIGSLLILQKGAGETSKAMAERIAENDRRSLAWSGTLKKTAGTLDDLVKTLESTRGQTVQLGAATERLAPAMTRSNEAISKAEEKLDKLKRKLGDATEPVLNLKNAILELSETTLAGLQPLSFVGGAENPILNLSEETMKTLPDIARQLANPFREAFGEFGKELPALIFGTLQQGGNIIGAIASGLAAKFSALFQQAIEAGHGLSGANKALGLAGVGLSALVGGFGIGRSQGSKTGALGGGLAGALSGASFGSVVPGIGTAVGAVVGGAIGLFSGLFGGSKKAKEELEKLREQQAAIVQQFGGLKKLTALANSLGVNLGNALNTKKPKEFEAAIKRLNEAIEDQKERWDGIQIAVEGVNKKAALFADPFKKLIESRKALGDDPDPLKLDEINRKLSETAQRSQGAFERLGVFVAATFAGMVAQTGDAIGAIQALAPSFKVLQQGVEEFGLAGTGTINALVGMFKVLNDETTGPLFESLQAVGQIFTGLQQGGLLTAELFQTVGADIGDIFREMEAKGVDMSVAMALSQPILQKLFEAQKNYGLITDETTQKILDQAKEQGLVGDHMKDVNQKILDVLLLIGDVLGAKIPDALRGIRAPAREAAEGIKAEFDKVKAPKFDDAFSDLEASAREATGGINKELKDIVLPPVTVTTELDNIKVPSFANAFGELTGAARTAAEGASRELATIQVPETAFGELGRAAQTAVESVNLELTAIRVPVVTHSFEGLVDAAGVAASDVNLVFSTITVPVTHGFSELADAASAVVSDVNRAFTDITVPVFDEAFREMRDAARIASEAVVAEFAKILVPTFPHAFSELPEAARTAVSQINDELGRIRAPTITVPVEFNVPDLPAFEAGAGVNKTVINIDGRQVAEAAARHIPEVMEGRF